MAGLIQRVCLLALAILCAASGSNSTDITTVTTATNVSDSADTANTTKATTKTTTTIYPTARATSHEATNEIPTTATTGAPTTVAPTTVAPKKGASTRGAPTTEASRTRASTSKPDGGKGKDSGSNGGNKESHTERIGSMAIAGLCLIIVALLLIAINGYVLFKSRMKSCSGRSGLFHVLPMAAIKKDRASEDDVEDNFREDGNDGNKTDSSTSLTKETPANQAAEQNGEVHVKVDVSDIAGPSGNKDEGGDAKKDEENKDSGDTAAATVDNESDKPQGDKPGEEVEKKNETVVSVTVESGKENQNEP